MKLKVKVSPNAKQNEVIGWFGDQLKIKIAARPEKGEANRELIKFLAKELSITKSEIGVLHGHTSSSKVLKIDGIDENEFGAMIGVVQVQNLLL